MILVFKVVSVHFSAIFRFYFKVFPSIFQDYCRNIAILKDNHDIKLSYGPLTRLQRYSV